MLAVEGVVAAVTTPVHIVTTNCGTDFYWQYDNTGLKLAQLRFYQVPTTVP